MDKLSWMDYLSEEDRIKFLALQAEAQAKYAAMSPARKAIEDRYRSPDRDEWYDADTADALAEALEEILDPVSGYQTPGENGSFVSVRDIEVAVLKYLKRREENR